MQCHCNDCIALGQKEGFYSQVAQPQRYWKVGAPVVGGGGVGLRGGGGGGFFFGGGVGGVQGVPGVLEGRSVWCGGLKTV